MPPFPAGGFRGGTLCERLNGDVEESFGGMRRAAGTVGAREERSDLRGVGRLG